MNPHKAKRLKFAYNSVMHFYLSDDRPTDDEYLDVLLAIHQSLPSKKKRND